MSLRRSVSEALALFPQQALRVAARDLGLVLVAQRHLREPRGTGRIRLERIVDREENSVDAHLLYTEQQRRVGEEAAGGDPEVRREQVAELDRLLPWPRESIVDAPKQE